MTLPLRDGIEVDALRTDHYLDALLAAHERRADDAPAAAELDPLVRQAARRLARELVRVHPSFRFEERLAGRLADVAATMRLPAAAGGEALRVPLRFPTVPGDPLANPLDSDHPPYDVRPLLIRGAITSAAISLAGAAYVAWRRSRPPLSPMARAVRAARQARLAVRAPLGGPRRRLD